MPELLTEGYISEQRRKLVKVEMSIVTCEKYRQESKGDCTIHVGDVNLDVNKPFMFGMYVARKGLLKDLMVVV